jgi:hypothetical protein
MTRLKRSVLLAEDIFISMRKARIFVYPVKMNTKL